MTNQRAEAQTEQSLCDKTMQVLSDKLTSRCVTSYLSALVTSKKDPCATSRFITSCRCVVSKPRTRYVTNRDKLWDD